MRFVIFISLFWITAATWAQGPGYQLSPMDKLTVAIAQDPVQGRPIELSVSPLGDLAVPVSRCCEESVIITARGKTVEQVEKELKERLEADYYKTATVQIRVIDPTRRKGQVFLQGQVRATSLLFDSAKPKTLWEALTEVGTTEYANLKKIKLDRGGKITEHDMEAVSKGNRSKDVELQDGDRISVPEKFLNFK